MYDVVRHRRWLIVLVLLAVAVPGYSDNVIVSGNVTFASLDGSSLDHDGSANGTFTVNDGDLTVLGSINCNDDTTRDACDMNFAVSGNLTVAAGGGLFAENRRGNGLGGNITATVGGNVAIGGTISSGNLSVDRAGDITITAGGSALLQAGSVVSGSSKGSPAGDISIQSGGAMDLRGLIAAGPSSTVTSTKYTAAVLNGGSSNSAGGAITLRSTSHAEPAISVSSDAVIVSQGENAGSDTVLLEGCGVIVNGLVASVSTAGVGAKVTIRTGTSATIDGSDLGAAGTHLGMLRADSLNQGAGTYSANIFARNAVTILGPASGSLYVLNSNGGKTSKDPSGTINVVSTAGGVTASGNVAAAMGSNSGDQGGTVNVSARDNVVLATANVNASGDFSSSDSSREGGAINVRSYSGAVSWQNGIGDVRPVGSAAGVPASQQGTISITYCTTVSTAGTSFPTNGSPVGTFPTVTQTCSPAAPTLPSGESHPDCNDPPIAVNDPYTVAEGETLNVAAPGVLGNDVDPDGDPITAILVSGPAHASSFTFNADGSFNYVHDGSETTSDSFTYKANDGSLDSNVATVIITITPVNDPPVANNDNYPVAEGGTLNVAAPGVLSNDTDPDGPGAAAILVSGPAHASSFVLNANGSFIYVHDGSETTSDSFTYRVSDGSLLSNIATVFITVTAVNDAPVANNDGPYTVAEGGTFTLPAPGVLSNDTDVDSLTLNAVLVTGPANASSFALNADGSFTYVHNGSETTSDSFTYRANDGSANSNVATVSITITPVNDAPVANNDGPYTVAEGGTFTLAAPGVLANDTDADSPSLTAVLVSGPAHASSFTLNADGSFSYVHDGSETPLTDSFTYQTSDGSALSNVATVSITITPVNDAPVAVNDSYNVNEGATLTVAAPGVLGNDTDAENNSLNAVLVSGPLHATSFTLNADGSFTYTHDGSETTSDSFTYKANDGSLDSNVATVTIAINAVNDAPVAVADAYGVAEGGTLTVVAPGVLINDTDVDSPTLTAILVSGPAHATSFTLNPNGSFTYVHDGSETTSDSFTYKANDGSLDSNVVMVTITITPVNDAPVAVNDAYNVNEGATLTVAAPGVLGNDTDADSPSFVAVLVTGPANASSFALNPDGSFTYVHNGSETTTDSFTYRANDGTANSNIATVTITITPVNDAPVAVNDSYTGTFGGTLNVTAPGVLGNDTDADGPSLTAILVTGPANATSFTLNPDGSFSYQHNGVTPGGDSFTYKANDGSLDSNVATVLINVVSQAPVANNDSYTDVGNTQLRVGTGTGTSPARSISGSVLDNDTDADTPHALLIASAPATSTQGGSVSMNPNGSFNYLPPVGFVGSDTFQYTVSDGLNNTVGTVTINLNGRIWYVKNNAPAGDGRSTLPFNGLLSAQSASAFGDVIFVHFGDGTTTGQNGGIVLQGSQALIGEGVALTSGADTLWPAGSTPTIGNTSGDVVTLASGNAVQGINLSASAAGIRGNSVSGGSFKLVNVNGGTDAISLNNSGGVFSMSQINLNPSSGSGLLVTGGTADVRIGDFHATTTATAASAIRMNAGGALRSLVGPNTNTLSSTNGIAVDINGAASILLDVAFVSVNASGSSHGIRIGNATGGFTVTGTGSTAGSGGTIQNMTTRGVEAIGGLTNLVLSNMNFVNAATTNGSTAAVCGDTFNGTNGGCNAALHLQNLTNVILTNDLVDGSAQAGINGNGINTLSMSNVEVRNAGNEVFEHGVQFVNLTGTATVSNSNFHNNFHRQFTVQNASGSLNLSISGSNFSSTVVGTGAQGALISGHGTASITLNVTGSTIHDNFSAGLFSDLADSATMDFTASSNTFTTNGGAISLNGAGSGAVTYAISGNTINTNTGAPITVNKGGGTTGNWTGTVTGNIIGTIGVPTSTCSVSCNAINMQAAGSGTYQSTIDGNTVRQVTATGITVNATNSVNVLVKVQNNTITNPNASAVNGVFVQSGTGVADTCSVCASITNNNVTGSYATGQFRVRNRFPGTLFRIPGYAGAGNDTTAVANYILSQNPGTTTATATINGNIFSGGPACF